MRVGIAANHVEGDVGDERDRAGSKPELAVATEFVADVAKEARPETMGNVKHAMMASRVWG